MPTGRAGNRSMALLGAAVVVGAYAYVAFPALLQRAARRHQCDSQCSPPAELPMMTVVIPAHNEASVIEAKVADIEAQDYDPGRLDILVVDDGSDDGTSERARAAGARVLTRPARAGKQAAINHGVAHAHGSVVCLTDANSRLGPGTLRALARSFADRRVAVVSGAKRIIGAGAVGTGEGLYWRLESQLKSSESAFGSVMGADGGVMAVRRDDFRPIPTGIVNDDFHLALDALSRGHDVRYAPEAVATETVSSTIGEEFERRTRIAAGTWQGVLGHLELADPRHPWRALAFVSHRVLRNVVLPVLLASAWLAAALGAPRNARARRAFAAQTAVYGAAAAGAASNAAVLAIPFQFAFTNLATLRGAWRYLTGRQPVAWRRTVRGDEA